MDREANERRKRLARVDWRMGQTLLPTHFKEQEEAILSNVAMRFQLLGRPYFGVAELKWDESQLIDGLINIKQLSLILDTGELIAFPGNATLSTFNLNDTGQSRVNLFCHIIGSQSQMVEITTSTGESIQRRTYNIVVNSEESMSSSFDTRSFCIAEFLKAAEGTWSLSDEYIPPLTQLNTSPFLMPVIEELTKQVENFNFKISKQIAATYLSGDSLHANKKILHAIYQLQAVLEDFNGSINHHPYEFYSALKNFYLELCFFSDVTPEKVKLPYVHHDLAFCFQSLLEPIFAMLRQVKEETPYISFEESDGMYKITRVPDKVVSSSQVYLLIQKARVGDHFAVRGFKLASIPRLSIVHQLSLGGVALEKIARPPFQHTFGAEVEFFRITGSEEWDYVLRDMSIAFYSQPEYANLKAYIYWREG